MRYVLLSIALLSCAAPAQQSRPTNWPPGTAGYHKLRLDAQGKILPWYGTTPAEGYDHVIRLVWDFWRKLPNCPNGVPYYLQHQVWKPDSHDPRGIGGDQIAMAISSWAMLYNYLGDQALIDNMRMMADYWLAHGMSKPDDLWANLPFPYNTDLHSGRYDGDMRAGKNFLQPDKAGSFGLELVRLYKITGEKKYLNAAIGIADTLSRRAKYGDADRSPWPFRVNATTGEVHTVVKDGKTYKADYTTHWTPTVQLFEQLSALDAPNKGGYIRAAGNAWEWLFEHPITQAMKTGKPRWGPFFEDIPTEDYSDTQINAGTAAYFLFTRPAHVTSAEAVIEAILDWTERVLGNREFEKYGVMVINEQTRYLAPGNSHTARHAAIELMFASLSERTARKEQAIRRLNWATYTVDTDGKNQYPQDDIWLTDGYGDYVRHYLRAMSAAPELAPDNQNHLLGTTSVIQHIEYGPKSITYRKFDEDSRERLKLGAGTPVSVKNGVLVKWDEKTRVAIIAANRNTITITLK